MRLIVPRVCLPGQVAGMLSLQQIWCSEKTSWQVILMEPTVAGETSWVPLASQAHSLEPRVSLQAPVWDTAVG